MNYYIEDFILVKVRDEIKILPLKNINYADDIKIKTYNDYKKILYNHPSKAMVDCHMSHYLHEK